MNTRPLPITTVVFLARPRAFTRVILSGALLALATWGAEAAQLQVLHNHVPPAVTNGPALRRSSRFDRLDLSIGLPLRNRAALTNLLQELYDPRSRNYRHFLTPEEFAVRFGPTPQDYEAVVQFARAQGLTVTATYSNRTMVSVRGLVANVEKAFHVTLGEYQHPTESRTFRAPDREPSVELAVPLLAVSGLDDFVIPHPCGRFDPIDKPKPNLTGSGPGGYYIGNDFRRAYAAGTTMTGTGQTVGLLEFDGFYRLDITNYASLAGLPNVPVNTVLLDGFNGTPGANNIEVALDIEMAMAMAPGLSQVLVYEGTRGDDILNRMATDKSANQISSSWSFGVDALTVQIYQQFGAQGQSYFNASGDTGAYSGAVASPNDDPYITVVGGTDLSTTSGGNAWVSETTWPASSGGISTTYAIPSWQLGISMSANKGSTSFRNVPDVAMVADNCWAVANNGGNYTVQGTSIAAPLWAGFTALVNQLALANGGSTVGFINPAIYAMGKGGNALPYTSLFHDITTGNNYTASSPTKFPATAGYDLCTGWGSPTGTNLMVALAFPEPLRVSPSGGLLISGPVGGPFSPASQNYTLTDGSSSSVDWSLSASNTAAWLTVSNTGGTLSSGGPAAIVTASLSASATSLPAGSYTGSLQFADLDDAFTQTRPVTLAIVTPPVISSQPSNQAALVGMTVNFSVGIASNALMYYAWRYNGVNLSDGTNVSGSATSVLSVSNVTAANVGAYSVVLSNAAGTLTSSNATLSIVASAPVVLLQPTNQNVLPGASATFSVGAVGNTPYFYQWKFNGTNVTNGTNFTGATTSTLKINIVNTTNAGLYSVVVSNSLGTTTSSNATLSVIPVTTPEIAMSTIWSFTGIGGAFPYAPLVQAKDKSYYGMTTEGGTTGNGIMFRITTNSSFLNLLNFNGTNNGGTPYAGLYLASDNLYYGGTYAGGTFSDGTLIRSTAAGVATNIVKFNGNNGMNPVAGMIQASDGNFYGTGYQGGVYGYGTVFRSTSSGNLTTLVSFDNADGALPSGVLVQAKDGNFYGTTENGGANDAGTLFMLTPAGTFTSMYSFTGGNDGAVPIAGVVQGTDGNFYGTTLQGGAFGYGTVFRLEPPGKLTTLFSFANDNNGANPWGGLVQATDGNLYGTTQVGGQYGYGTVFRIAPNGPLTTVVQFENFNGANPSATLVQGSDGYLYGTTVNGGTVSAGTVFRFNVIGPLQITGQPADQTIYQGGTAIFSVATVGASPVSYQWQQDGVNLTNGDNISGANSATLVIASVALSNAALYSVVVSNSFGAVASDDAALEVIYSPVHILAQPTSQSVVAGQTVVFSVTAAGDEPLTYQWLSNGTNLTDGGNITGSLSNNLVIANVALANAGGYSVIITNPVSSVTSKTAQLTVTPVSPPSAVLTTLKSFNGTSDGAFPFAGLMQARDGNLYGTAEGGGANFQGTIFKVATNGTESTVFSFPFNTSGAKPFGGLVQGSGSLIYGTTSQGGTGGAGTLYSLNTNLLVGFIYSFTGGADGAAPMAALVLGKDGLLYGTASQGGNNGFGGVFRLNSDNSVTPLYSFTGGLSGTTPFDTLIQARDGKLYGTTYQGGVNNYGTVFSLTTNGVLTTLGSFNGVNGAYPQAGLTEGVDGTLYGTTLNGGSANGTVFAIPPGGTITTVFTFNGTNGGGPAGEVIQGTDGNLYGTTSFGGAGGQGSVFRLTTNGVLTTLAWFNGFNGSSPNAKLLQAKDGSFYGTTVIGGNGYNPSAGGGNGTIFKLTIPIFITNTITATAAVAALPYSGGTISGQAVAPAGDALTFAKTGGPAWLSVATNGVLSGTPTNSDIGTNMFIVSLTDSNGFTSTANLQIVVIADPPPSFITNPFTEPSVNAGVAYSASIATNATAPYLGAGDVLTFSKVSGPAWLGVAPNGTLSGTPSVSDAGTNSFGVSVVDLGGSAVTATMYINVINAASPIVGTISVQGTNVQLNWSGSAGQYQVQMTTNLANPNWQNVGGPTSVTNLVLPTSNSAAFYRIQGQ